MVKVLGIPHGTALSYVSVRIAIKKRGRKSTPFNELPANIAYCWPAIAMTLAAFDLGHDFVGKVLGFLFDALTQL